MNIAGENPYSSPAALEASTTELSKRKLSRFAILTVAVLIGCGVAILVGESLSFLVLIPPLNGWLRMNGEFDGLILIGMPVIAGGISLLVTLVLGFSYPRKYSGIASLLTGWIAVGIFHWNIAQTISRPREWYSTATVSSILFIAITCGSVIALSSLTRLSRRMHDPELRGANEAANGRGRRIFIVCMTVLWLLLDAVVWLVIIQSDMGLLSFSMCIFAFVFGLGSIATCSYYAFAGQATLTTARVCLGVLLVSFVATLYAWVRYGYF